MIDLHLHTNLSDGSLEPGELIDLFNSGDVISITDHDEVGAIDKVLNIARIRKINLVPGIELSTDYLKDGKNVEVHVLGYFIDYENSLLLEKLNEFKQSRVNAIEKMVGNLNNLGMYITTNDVKNMTRGTSLGRPHIARALIKKGYFTQEQTGYIIDTYLEDGKPCYFQRKRIPIEEAIDLIDSLHGVSSLAHPGFYKKLDNVDIENILKSNKFDAFEVFHPDNKKENIPFYLELAKKYNLQITCGSDYHGRNYHTELGDHTKLKQYDEKLILNLIRLK